MKIKQLAIAVPDFNLAKKILSDLFDSDFIIDDEDIKMSGFFDGKQNNNIDLKLSFDYNTLSDLDELELIKSDSIEHWHHNSNGFVSHLGIYCESESELNIAIARCGQYFYVLQDSISKDHSRPNEDGSERKYRDVVFKSNHILGFNIKLSLKV